MHFIYTKHCEETIEDRELNKEIVEATILFPDNLGVGKQGRKIAHKIIEGKLLRIIYEKEKDVYITPKVVKLLELSFLMYPKKISKKNLLDILGVQLTATKIRN